MTNRVPAYLVHPLMWQHSNAGGCTVRKLDDNHNTGFIYNNPSFTPQIKVRRRSCHRVPLTWLMCQLQFFAIVTRSERSKSRIREAAFHFWRRYFTDLKSRWHGWRHTSVCWIIVKASSGSPMARSPRNSAYIHPNHPVLCRAFLQFPWEILIIFWYADGLLLLALFSPPLFIPPTAPTAQQTVV